MPTPVALSRRRMFELAGLAGVGMAASSALSGCAARRVADGTVTMATSNDGVWPDHLRESAAMFQARNPGCRIEFTPLPESALDAWLVARTAAGQAPDIVQLGVSAVSRYSRNGTAVDIAPYLPAGYMDSYLPVLAALVERDGKVFGLPKETTCMTCYYRRDVVDRIGARIPGSPEDGWSWDEFRQMCVEAKRITGRYGTSYGYINANSGNRWLPALYQRGGSLFDGTGTPAMSGPAAEAALEWSRSFYAEGLISLGNTVKASQADTAASLFTTGQVGFMVHEAQVSVLRKSMPDEQWGVTYLFTADRPATNLSGSVHVVTSSSPDPELAARFLHFASSPERSTPAIRDRGTISPFATVTPQDVGYRYRPDDIAISIEQLASVPESVGQDMATRDYQTVREVLGDALDLLFIGQASAAETAERIERGLANA
ncbi:sugar ABC transporter substrate-binding protein [Saccharopolyspora erythraea]|uniref:ABC transporter substrate-binding protein n=1 Tax=Saccharopolyspora erythraea TaxID=1836 RepID=UPI001BA4D27F|nr:sugar ABC transporter substrate-binding protein [Saccharopolyspora erythraea]QUH01839.1 sugar ABC transporter substrate-binding protein [Saccharopolyspora erythraea]